MADVLERVYTVPLVRAYETVRTKRARRAVALLKSFVLRHMKADDVVISNATNSFIWKRSMQHPPRKLKIRVVKEGQKARVYLQDEKPEVKKEEKPADKKGEAKTADKKADAKKKEEPENRKAEGKAPEKPEHKAGSMQHETTAGTADRK